jgi:hypothetical protein
MALYFNRVASPMPDMEIWNASSNGFSFVISYGTRTGSGFRGKPGYVASWRSLSQNAGAARVGGSPFNTFTEAEETGKVMLEYLMRGNDVPFVVIASARLAKRTALCHRRDTEQFVRRRSSWFRPAPALSKPSSRGLLP